MAVLCRWVAVLSMAAIVIVYLAVPAEAQEGGRVRSERSGGAGASGGVGVMSLQLVRRPDVQEELRLTASQVKKINELGRGVQELLRGELSGLRGDLSPQERQEAFAKLRENIEKQRQGSRDKVMAILNRRQRARFAELEFQFSLQRGSVFRALAGAGIELDDADTAKLRSAQREAQEQMRREMSRIQQQANMKALSSVLSRERVERLMGDAFTFDVRAAAVGSGPRPRSSRDVGAERTPESGARGRSRRDRRRRPSGGR